MATIPVGVDENLGAGEEGGKGIIRVILADTQAIFRAGLRKIFALEDDIRVVGQAETLAQTQTAVKSFPPMFWFLNRHWRPIPWKR